MLYKITQLFLRAGLTYVLEGVERVHSEPLPSPKSWDQDVASVESFTPGGRIGTSGTAVGSVTKLYLNLHGAGCQGRDLFLHAVSNTRVHGGAP